MLGKKIRRLFIVSAIAIAIILLYSTNKVSFSGGKKKITDTTWGSGYKNWGKKGTSWGSGYNHWKKNHHDDKSSDDDCCDGKVTELTLQYNGIIDDAFIEVVQKKDHVTVFSDSVQPGGIFTFSGSDKKVTLGTEISIFVSGVLNTKIHTNCSKPIGPGLVSGDFEVVEGYSRNGGLLCSVNDNGDGTECPDAPVAKTGQTTCYDQDNNIIDCTDTGQDGEKQAGVDWPNPRFTDSGDGTITDNLTGLIWLKDANCIKTEYPGFDNDNTSRDGAVVWQHALDFVLGINDGTYADCGAGFTDWRLPNVRELSSIIHYGIFRPALSNTDGTGQWSNGDPFFNVQSFYWSSTSRADRAEVAYFVDIGVARISSQFKSRGDFFRVWCVRGGP